MKIARLTLNLVLATQFWSNNIGKPFLQDNIQLYSSSRFFKSEAPASIFHRFLKYNTQFSLTLSSSLPTCLHVPCLAEYSYGSCWWCLQVQVLSVWWSGGVGWCGHAAQDLVRSHGKVSRHTIRSPHGCHRLWLHRQGQEYHISQQVCIFLISLYVHLLHYCIFNNSSLLLFSRVCSESIKSHIRLHFNNGIIV